MNFSHAFIKGFLVLSCFLLFCSNNLTNAHGQADVGVLFVFHGGMEVNRPQYMFDAVLHQFSYNPNHSVYKFVIWSPNFWPLALSPDATDFATRFLRMYEFEYERIGGTDPFHGISMQQMADMKDALDANPYGLTFEVDWSGYMAADQADHYAYPRFLYYGPDGLADPDGDFPDCKYCGEGESRLRGCRPALHQSLQRGGSRSHTLYQGPDHSRREGMAGFASHRCAALRWILPVPQRSCRS